jgi:hypothetical protein
VVDEKAAKLRGRPYNVLRNLGCSKLHMQPKPPFGELLTTPGWNISDISLDVASGSKYHTMGHK